jgi:GNAT superfamily N-acetyltransferase
MQNESEPVLSHAEPILAVQNVSETVSYWHDVLGFIEKWTWGEPPNYGGVSWQGAFIQFSQNRELASVSKGNAIFIKVKNLQTLYDFHQGKNVEIVEPLENKPWDMAGYTVKEINGYYIVFAGAALSESRKRTATSPQNVTIIRRSPTPDEYFNLIAAVGWGKYSNHEMADKILTAPVFAVVAENNANHEVIGCALLLSDQASFYYVKDVMVHPEWQGNGIGTKLMREIVNWMDMNAPEHAYVGLFTPENLAPFYKQFDFVPVFGMNRRIQSSKR